MIGIIFFSVCIHVYPYSIRRKIEFTEFWPISFRYIFVKPTATLFKNVTQDSTSFLHAIPYAKASCQVLRKLLRTESAGVGGMAPLIKHFEKITQVEFIAHGKKKRFQGKQT